MNTSNKYTTNCATFQVFIFIFINVSLGCLYVPAFFYFHVLPEISSKMLKSLKEPCQKDLAKHRKDPI